MSVLSIGTVSVALALSVLPYASHANNNNANQNWVPHEPTSNYWQTPNWSGFNMPQSSNSAPPRYNAPPPGNMPPQGRNQNNGYRPPAPQNYNQPYPGNNYQAPNRNQQNMNRAAPPRPPQNAYRGNPYPQQQRGPYQGQNMNQNRRDNGASAFNIPGFNRNNNGNNNGWNNNKFWGNSGPSRWMNPNKGNMEQGWDDMINSPSRVGEMPGGWTAPEVTMPNPVDIGDQFQDNAQDLPEQMQNMDVGN